MNEYQELRPPQDFVGPLVPSTSELTPTSGPARHITNDSTGTHVTVNRSARTRKDHRAQITETELEVPERRSFKKDKLAEISPASRRPTADYAAWSANRDQYAPHDTTGIRICPQPQPSPDSIDIISPYQIAPLRMPRCDFINNLRCREERRRPRAIPELRIKHRQPVARSPLPGGVTFRDKYRLHLRSPIKKLDTPSWHMPRLGPRLSVCGDRQGLAKPPHPVPTSALGFATCWDEDVLRRKRAESRRSVCRGESPPQPRRGGGLRSFVEDALGLSALALAEAVETVGNTLLQTVGPLPRSVEAAPPQPLYADPSTGRLPKRPEAPTIATGHSLVDKINRYLDEVLCDSEKHPRLIISPGPITPPTQPTGNAVVDKTNRFLDRVLAPPPKKLSTESTALPPASDMAQKIRCTLHCRDRCSFDRWDCAGLKFQRTWLQHEKEDDMPEPSLIDRLLGNKRTCRYDEKLGERWCPSLYNREGYYCPHCDRNRYTGKTRKRVELQWPVMVETEDNYLDGEVDFEISDLIAS